MGSLEENEVYEVEGKKLTGREIKSGVLMHSDYTKKTQELAQQRQELDTQVNQKVEEKLAAIRPEVEKVIEKGTKIDQWLEKDPESYTRFVAFSEGQPIPVVDHGKKPSSQQRSQETPPPVRDKRTDEALGALEQRVNAADGERIVSQFAQEEGLDPEFVWNELLPIASKEFSTSVPPRQRLERTWEAWKGKNADEYAKHSLTRRMNAAHISGGGRAPIDESRAAKIREETLGKIKGSTRPAWLR